MMRRWAGRAASLRPLVLTAVLSLPAASVVSAQSSVGPAEPPVNLYGVVPPDASGVQGAAASDLTGPAAGGAIHAKRGEFLIAPLPMVNPTLENGLAFAVGYLYRVDATDTMTAPSVSAIGGFKTSNGSWAGMAFQSLRLAHDRFRFMGVFGYSDLNYAFYGIGEDAGAAGSPVELNQTGPVGVVEGLVRVRNQWYVGARYLLLHMRIATLETPLEGPAVPPDDADLRTAGLGPRVDFDSRDNPFYPRTGLQFQGVASFYGESVGGRRSYQAYEGMLNGYQSVGTRHVLAWHVGACGVSGAAPFYDLCMLGRSRDLRGYPMGQYRDRAMIATQAEWRSEWWWRFGATAFLGAGEVKPDFGALTWKDALPGGGVGLRFTLAQRNHVNLRADYAWGRDSTGLYISVAEAF